MTQDEIIEMAKSINEDWWLDDIDLQAFAKLVAEAEREACAKVCDARATEYDGFTEEQNASEKLATTIRGRGQA